MPPVRLWRFGVRCRRLSRIYGGLASGEPEHPLWAAALLV